MMEMMREVRNAELAGVMMEGERSRAEIGEETARQIFIDTIAAICKLEDSLLPVLTDADAHALSAMYKG
ncbi:hypothetical protein NFJ02_03g103990 [Pycnococcus provasolii]